MQNKKLSMIYNIKYHRQFSSNSNIPIVPCFNTNIYF